MVENKYTFARKGMLDDFYDVLDALGATCPATQHAIKTLLMPGMRGHKPELGELLEARTSVDRAIDLARERKAFYDAKAKQLDAIFSQGTSLALGVCEYAPVSYPLTDRELRDVIIRDTVDDGQDEPPNASPKFSSCPACGDNQIDGECSFTLCPTHTEPKESK